MADRAAIRRELGAAAVISLATAARWLPVRDSAAREWLRERGLVRQTQLGEVVLWADVLSALRQDDEPQPRARRGKLARVDLSR